MRVHKDAFFAIVQARVRKLTNNYNNIDSTLSSALLDLILHPSRGKIKEILEMIELESLQNRVTEINGTRSQIGYTLASHFGFCCM